MFRVFRTDLIDPKKYVPQSRKDKRMAKSEIAPHVCPQCGSPCYQGAFALECTGLKCDHYHAETAAAYGRERFPSVDSIEDEKTPTYGSGLWPAVKPAAVFPDTDAELVQQIKDGVAEALKDATPDEARELKRWQDEILKDYLSGVRELMPGWTVTHYTAERNAASPNRLDLSFTLVREIPVSHVSLDYEFDLGPAKDAIAEAAQVPRSALFLDDEKQGKLDAAIQAYVLKSDIHFPTLQQKVTDYVDTMRRMQEAALTGVSTDIAFGMQLDKWAGLQGTARAPGETDAELRKRIQAALKIKKPSQFDPGCSL